MSQHHWTLHISDLPDWECTVPGLRQKNKHWSIACTILKALRIGLEAPNAQKHWRSWKLQGSSIACRQLWGRSRPSSMPYIVTWALGLSPAHGVMACPFVFAAWLRFCSNRAVADCGRRLLGAAASAEPKNAKRNTDLDPWCSVLFRVCPRRPGKSHLGKPLRKPHYSSFVFKLVLCTPSQMLRTSHIHRTHMCVCFDYNAYVYVMSVRVCIIHSTINFQGEKPRSQTDCSPQPLEPSCSQCHTSGTSY